MTRLTNIGRIHPFAYQVSLIFDDLFPSEGDKASAGDPKSDIVSKIMQRHKK